MSLEKGPLSQWQQSEREALYGSFQTSWESLQAEIVDAEKNVSITLNYSVTIREELVD